VYDKCCKKIPELKFDASSKQNYGSSYSDDSEQFVKFTAMRSANESLQSVGESHIKRKGLGKGRYPTSKIKVWEPPTVPNRQSYSILTPQRGLALTCCPGI
jgi:hypothetical protein